MGVYFSIGGFIGGDFRNFIAGDENISDLDVTGAVEELNAFNNEIIH